MSNFYRTDNWVVIKIDDGNDPHYRVLAGWSGGYLEGDSWRMNSGITKVEEDEAFYYFYGASGSRYRCCKESYRLRMNNAHILYQLQQIHGYKVEMVPEDTDWINMDWSIK